MANHPTSKRRRERQKVKERYAEAREDAQLSGVIPTTPEGAVRPEAVNPASQDSQRLESIDRQAVRDRWDVPPELKAKVIERLGEVFWEGDRVVVTRDGRVVTIPPDRGRQTENARVLLLADQRQYERDHPEEAGAARGANRTTSTTTATHQTNILTADLAGLFRAVDQARSQQVTGQPVSNQLPDGLKELTHDQSR